VESIEAHAGETVIERVAGIDVGKAEVVCCVRVPDAARPGRRGQEVRTFSTMTAALGHMCDWFAELGVRRVVMESTSDYWKPPFYVLEARGFEPWLINAREVKHLPGRPKTDRIDAVWLAKLAERQMVRPSFVLPPELRELRELARYRVDMVVVRNSEKQRAEKLLEDAQIKVSVVASDLFGVSGRAMMAALIEGERDPERLADLARGVLRKKTPELIEALTGRFNDDHAWRLAKILQRVDDTDRDIAAIDARIEAHLAPFAEAVAALDQIPGIDRVAAAAVIAEIGVDMTRFPTPGHLCSWAGFAPLARSSAGREKKRKTGHGVDISPGPWATPPPARHAPRPTWVNDNVSSLDDAARTAPTSPPAARSWWPSGTSWPNPAPPTSTSARTGESTNDPHAHRPGATSVT